MQMGAYEALSLKQPIVTSDWAILRESFGDGAVYVSNTPEAISKGVLKLLKNHIKYKEAICLQRLKRRKYFNSVRKQILKKINSAS